MTLVAIALGSNLGDREATLNQAVDRLRAILMDVRVSSWHDTEPVDAPLQPRFLNGALVGRTTRSAHALLASLQQIEREAGRERPFPNAPRTLDLDLIFYGDRIIDEPDLRVPHPRFRARRFVLEPLSEIAPDWIDPETGVSVRELLERAYGGPRL
jgi:2-amino-4-hydroxy-6-hydroxymethyldihydropteridine diphosphokinase